LGPKGEVPEEGGQGGGGLGGVVVGLRMVSEGAEAGMIEECSGWTS